MQTLEQMIATVNALESRVGALEDGAQAAFAPQNTFIVTAEGKTESTVATKEEVKERVTEEEIVNSGFLAVRAGEPGLWSAAQRFNEPGETQALQEIGSAPIEALVEVLLELPESAIEQTQKIISELQVHAGGTFHGVTAFTFERLAKAGDKRIAVTKAASLIVPPETQLLLKRKETTGGGIVKWVDIARLQFK